MSICKNCKTDGAYISFSGFEDECANNACKLYTTRQCKEYETKLRTKVTQKFKTLNTVSANDRRVILPPNGPINPVNNGFSLQIICYPKGLLMSASYFCLDNFCVSRIDYMQCPNCGTPIYSEITGCIYSNCSYFNQLRKAEYVNTYAYYSGVAALHSRKLSIYYVYL